MIHCACSKSVLVVCTQDSQMTNYGGVLRTPILSQSQGGARDPSVQAQTGLYTTCLLSNVYEASRA